MCFCFFCLNVLIISLSSPSPAQEDHVHSEIPRDPACADVYLLWHLEGPPRPLGAGASAQDHLPEYRGDRAAGDAGVGVGAHLPEHAHASAVGLLRLQLGLRRPAARPQQLLRR